MRQDGRKPDELRPVRFELNYTRYAEGSVLISQGHTHVLCNASVEEKLPPCMSKPNSNRGWVTAEYSTLPRSTHTRTQRETTTPQSRTMEIRRLVGRSLRAVNPGFKGSYAFERVESYYSDPSTNEAIGVLRGRITKEEQEIVEKYQLVGILRRHERVFEKFRL